MQKSILFVTACQGQHKPSSDFDLILADFAEFLNVEGHQILASMFLSRAQGQSYQLNDIKYKLHASYPQLGQMFRAPTAPYKVEPLRINQVNYHNT
mmetsp:Transcript_3055/g.5159  ORF Transcript_3055/g.5159 Transcript_3055/m.5159 type:complete len:96 (-) Transcript_3055:1492-1779(-)